jgi:hypothetical protein
VTTGWPHIAVDAEVMRGAPAGALIGIWCAGVPEERDMPRQSEAVRRLRRFKPGHLVTDQDLNLFVEAIKDLDRRLAALQAAVRKLSSGKR